MPRAGIEPTTRGFSVLGIWHPAMSGLVPGTPNVRISSRSSHPTSLAVILAIPKTWYHGGTAHGHLFLLAASRLPPQNNGGGREPGSNIRDHRTDRQAVDDLLAVSQSAPSHYLFRGQRHDGHLTTRQYARLLDGWLSLIGLDPSLFGTHSLRRTKATLIYRTTGNLRAVQLLLGHTRIENTVRYLGIEVDDALAIAEQVEV